MLLLYKSIAISHILYSKCILLNLNKSKLKSIQLKLTHSGAIINNCLLKYVDGSNFSLPFILDYYCFILLFKILKSKFSPQLSELLKAKPHIYNTRANGTLYIERCKSSKYSHSFQIFAPAKWNSLPDNVRNETSLVAFKQKLFNFLHVAWFSMYLMILN